jgi:hypothetical protein
MHVDRYVGRPQGGKHYMTSMGVKDKGLPPLGFGVLDDELGMQGRVGVLLAWWVFCG